jgi:hypothetical protein
MCRSSGMLRIVGTYLVTDVSGQPIAPTFKGQAVMTLEYWTNKLSRNVGD